MRGEVQRSSRCAKKSSSASQCAGNSSAAVDAQGNPAGIVVRGVVQTGRCSARGSPAQQQCAGKSSAAAVRGEVRAGLKSEVYHFTLPLLKKNIWDFKIH